MADRVEILYQIKTSGEAELQRLAQAQRLARLEVDAINPSLRAQDQAARQSAAGIDAAARSTESLASKSKSVDATGLDAFSASARKAGASVSALGDLVEESVGTATSRIAKLRDEMEKAADALTESPKSRRANFAGGGFDAELGEEQRTKARVAAHQYLDQAVQKQQLSEVAGLERIEAKRQILLTELGHDADLRTKINALADREVAAETRKQSKAKELAESQQIASARERVLSIEQSMLSPLQRIEAERQKLLAMAKQDEDLQKRINNVFDERAKKETSNSGLGGQIRNAIQNPLQALGNIAGDTAEALGPVGIAVAAIFTAATLGADKLIGALHQVTQEAKQLENTSIRLGLPVAEVEKLSAAAQIAGVNIGTLEASARFLAVALEEPAGAGKKVVKALNDIGISIFDASGKIREGDGLLVSVLEHLAAIPEFSARVLEAQRILGRGSKELLPLLANYDALQDAVRKLHIGLDSTLNPSLSKADEEFTKLSLSVKQLFKELAAEVAPIVIPIIRRVTDEIAGREQPGPSKLGTPPTFNASAPDFFDARDKAQARFVPKVPTAADLAGIQAAARQRATLEVEAEKDAQAFAHGDARTKEGLERAKKEAETRRGVAELAVADKTQVGDARAKAHTELDQANADVRRIEASIKALGQADRDREAVKREVDAFTKAANEFELTGIQKILAKRDDLIDKLHKQHAAQSAINAINAAADKQVAKETGKEDAAAIRQQLALLEKRATLNFRPDQELEAIAAVNAVKVKNAADAFARDNDEVKRKAAASAAANQQEGALLDLLKKQHEERRKTSEEFELTRAQAVSAIATREIEHPRPGGIRPEDDLQRQAQDAHTEKLRLIDEEAAIRIKDGDDATAVQKQQDLAVFQAAVALEQRLFDIRRQKEQELLGLQLKAVQERANHSAQILELTSRPGDESGNIERLHALRIKAAQEQAALDGDRAALAERLDQAEYERTVKLLELRKKGLDQFREAAGRIFDALESKGGQGLREFFVGFFKTIERTIFQNIAGLAFEKIRDKVPKIPGQTKIGPDGKPQPTLLGRILAGTPFGADLSKDQLKTAVEAETNAAGVVAKTMVRLTERIDALTNAIGTDPGKRTPEQIRKGLDPNADLGKKTADEQAEDLKKTEEALKNKGGLSTTPLVQSTDTNTVATDRNTAALQALTAKLEGLPAGTGGNAAGAAVGAAQGILSGLSTSNAGGNASNEQVTSTITYDGGASETGSATTSHGGDYSTGSGETSTEGSGIPTGANEGANSGSGEGGGTAGSTAGSTASGIAAGVGKAVAIAAAAAAVFQGISQASKGGARNVLTGGGEAAIAIAPFTGPAAPFVLAAGVIAEGIAKLLPDPRKERDRQETRELETAKQQGAKYNLPGLNITEDSSGRAVAYDAHGHVRVLNEAPIVQSYDRITGFDPLHPKQTVTSPERQIAYIPFGSQPAATTQQPGAFGFGSRSGTDPLAAIFQPFGSGQFGSGPSIQAPPQSTAASSQPIPAPVAPPPQPPITIHLTVHAMDAKSIVDRSRDIADAVSKEMFAGTHRIQSDIRSLVRPM